MFDEYEKVEEELLLEEVHEYAKSKATDNVNFFFEDDRKKHEWDQIALIKKTHKIGSDGLPVLSPLDRFRKSKTFKSKIINFVNNGEETHLLNELVSDISVPDTKM